MDRPPSDMRPTEALFDSVNRGDIASARDAVSRGAELDAHNVLGLTPVELAVDLGRNDITFLLLSMRGESPASLPTAHATAQAASAKPVKQQAIRATAVRTASAPVAKPVQPAKAQQYANVPDVPAPQAGFLGFGATTTR
jgi:hypothetical protein